MRKPEEILNSARTIRDEVVREVRRAGRITQRATAVLREVVRVYEDGYCARARTARSRGRRPGVGPVR